MIKQEVIPMDGELHPIGTLMYEDNTIPRGDSDWRPHRNIWRVIAHREVQDFPNAPIKVACELRLAYQEDL